MKKPYTHLDLDPERRCVECGKPLKKNVLARKSKAPRWCYKHYLDRLRAWRNRVDPSATFEEIAG